MHLRAIPGGRQKADPARERLSARYRLQCAKIDALEALLREETRKLRDLRDQLEGPCPVAPEGA